MKKAQKSNQHINMIKDTFNIKEDRSTVKTEKSLNKTIYND